MIVESVPPALNGIHAIADKSWKITLHVAITHFLNEYLEIYLISGVDQPYKVSKIQLTKCIHR